jgi:DNA-binding transcriptional LysR family regulator
MIGLTLRRLQVFTAIVETGSFAGAARRLGIAQPSVSAHVRAIEREVNGALFDRQSGRQAVLTSLGRNFLGHAREMLANAVKLEADIASRSSHAERSVTFACQRSLANTVLRDVLSSFARGHRDVRMSVHIAFQEEVIAAVRMGAADLGCLMSNEEPAGVPSTLIGRQRFVVFAAPDHPLARRKKVRPAELSAQDFVGPVATSMFGVTQNRLLSWLGVERVNVVSEATEFGLVRDLCAAGLGLACSLYASVADDVEAGRIVVLDIEGPPLFIDVRLLINAQRRNVPAVQDFASELRAAGAGWS